MCGRYTLTASPEALRALFAYAEQPNLPQRFNIAPTQPIPIVRLVEGKRQFALVRWGLLPSWVKDPKTFTLLINARGEGVTDKPAFRAAMKRRRCLIPADGFYEWQKAGERKRPFYVHAKSGKPLAFAGLWETWTGPNGEELDTAAIVTTRANRTLAPIHDRMPVIVPPEAFDLWLNSNEVDATTAAGAARAGARRPARGLRDFDCGQPHRQRQSEGDRADCRRARPVTAGGETARAARQARQEERRAVLIILIPLASGTFGRDLHLMDENRGFRGWR